MKMVSLPPLLLSSADENIAVRIKKKIIHSYIRICKLRTASDSLTVLRLFDNYVGPCRIQPGIYNLTLKFFNIFISYHFYIIIFIRWKYCLRIKKIIHTDIRIRKSRSASDSLTVFRLFDNYVRPCRMQTGVPCGCSPSRAERRAEWSRERLVEHVPSAPPSVPC